MAHATTDQHTHAAGHAANLPAGHAAGEHQQHPISLYLFVWGLLFVLSAFSYMVDYYQLQGALRWTLILVFMVLKAGLIVAVFMHMAFERLAMICAIILPPVFVLIFVALMAIESDYTEITRALFFRTGS